MSFPEKPISASLAWGLPVMCAVSVLARTTAISLIPVMAYHHLGTAQRVSEIYFVSSIAGIATSLLLPKLLMRIGYWPVLLSATASGIGSAAALTSDTLSGLVLGLVLHVLMVLIFENVMSLYILQNISRQNLTTFEPRRMLLAGFAFGLGPWLAVWLTNNAGVWLALSVSACCATLVPMSAIALKLDNGERLSVSTKLKDHSVIRSFISQPRLKLAWLLAAIRACWWSTYFVYTPIFAVSYGLGASVGSIMIAVGSVLLVLSPFWSHVVRQIGMRRLLLTAYAGAGGGTIVASILAGFSARSAAAMLLVSAVAMSAIDAMGNVPFLHAVRSHQRTSMTPIFNTYRDVAQVAPAGAFAVTLVIFPLSSVFVISGVLMAVGSVLCLYLPRRL